MITEDISQQDLDAIEKYADKLFAKVGIDVEFTRHFLDRANDERNKKPITAPELIRIFRQEYKRWAKPIAQLGPDAEAVMKDMATDINVPFVLKWDRENGELDLVAKTVMRKPNFKTPDREFPVEGSTGTTHSWNQLQTGLKSTFGHNTPVKTKTSGQVQKPKIKTAFNKVKDTVTGWFGEDDTKTDYAKLDIKQAEPIRAKFTPDWEIRKGKMLYKRVAFDDYNQALEFLEKLKEPQTELDHFADIQIFYNELEIVIYTHDVDGLTQLDFELALYVDDLVRKMSARIVDESACKYGRYYCSTDKKFKCRQGPKQSRTNENFADGKVKGKSRPGRVKRAGASCKGSVTDLRRKAKNASGEKAKMYHWCANMKSGRKKSNEETNMKQSAFAQTMYEEMQIQEKSRCKRTRAESCQCESIERINEAQQPVMAMCELTKEHGVEGLLLMAGAPGAPTVIVGEIHGLKPGLHGLHIHEYGNLTDGCKSAGAHYNPDGVDHGDLNEGHVGDLGNITADEDGTARIEIVAPRVELIGERSVIGRSFVVHADEDDLGKGGDAESLKTGNAGDRLGCGVIVMTENTMSEGKLDEVLPALAVGAAARAILPRALPYLARGAKAAWRGAKRLVKPKNQKVDKKPKNNKPNNKADKKNLRRRAYGLGMGGGAGAGASANTMSGDTDATWTYSRPGQGIGERLVKVDKTGPKNLKKLDKTSRYEKRKAMMQQTDESIPSSDNPNPVPNKVQSHLRKKEIMKDLDSIIKDLAPELKPDGIEIDPDDYRDNYEKFKKQGKPYKITQLDDDRAHQGDQSSFMQFGKIKPGTVKTGADGRKYKWLGAQWQDVATGRMASIDQRQQNNLRNKKVTVTKRQAKDTAKAVGKGALAGAAAVAGLARGAMSNIGKIGDKGSDYNLKVRAAEAIEKFTVTYNGTQVANDHDSVLDLLQDNGYDVDYDAREPALYDALDMLRDEGYEVNIDNDADQAQQAYKLARDEEPMVEGKRIPRKKGQKANSKKHSDLYTDENPKGTIHGLKFATVKDAEASVRKIKSSGKTHAHKIQAAVAMEQRAKAAGKTSAAAVYRKFINSMKKKTKAKNEAAGVGKIVKGVNTTPDVGVDAIRKQAAKFGFDVDKDGTPKHKLR